MRPTLKTKTVVVPYWDCGNEQHTHRTEEAAAKCIANASKAAKYKRWDDAALAEVLALHRSGVSTTDIAARYGVSRERIYQIRRKAERAERKWYDQDSLGIGP